MNNDPLRYAGFGPRFCSLFLDGLFFLPLMLITGWASSRFRLFDVYYFIPSILLGLFYDVYLVKRYGGTPGKLIMGIGIRKVNGEPVGYREAFLRNLVDLLFCLVISIAMLLPLFHMTDAEYQSLSYMHQIHREAALAPSWLKPVQWAQEIWFWGELVVLLTNRKRRALHDFIAGTVVIHTRPAANAESPATPAPVPG
jgi:uncharacterized RDD family membrane protein YckC